MTEQTVSQGETEQRRRTDLYARRSVPLFLLVCFVSVSAKYQHRVPSTGDGVPTSRIDWSEDLASGTRLRELRRHWLGARVLRDGRDRRAGARSDGPRD